MSGSRSWWPQALLGLVVAGLAACRPLAGPSAPPPEPPASLDLSPADAGPGATVWPLGEGAWQTLLPAGWTADESQPGTALAALTEPAAEFRARVVVTVESPAQPVGLEDAHGLAVERLAGGYEVAEELDRQAVKLPAGPAQRSLLNLQEGGQELRAEVYTVVHRPWEVHLAGLAAVTEFDRHQPWIQAVAAHLQPAGPSNAPAQPGG